MKPFIYLLLAMMLFMVAAWRLDELAALRREHRLNAREVASGVPPSYLLADSLLGGFRSFLISALWQQAQEKKAQAQFYEMTDLYHIITLLEPNYPNAWANIAWDLSYNVAAEFTEHPQARVYWFAAGVKLLREQALRYNPHSDLLYEQLSWLFFNKATDSLDPAFAHYRRYLATEMTNIVGDNYYLTKPLTPAIREALSAKLNMNAEIMLALNHEFSPIDWRLAAAQSLYWAWGGQAQLLRRDVNSTSLRNIRMIYFSLIQLAHQGTGIVTSSGLVIGAPNHLMVEQVIGYMEKIFTDQRYDHVITGIRQSFILFLAATVLNYYFADERLNAERMREKLLHFVDADEQENYRGTLTQYIKRALPEFIAGLNDHEAMMLAITFCQRAYHYLIMQQPQKYQEQMAWFATNYEQILLDWQKRFNATFSQREQYGMPTADELCAQIAARIFNQETQYTDEQIAKFRAGLRTYAPQILQAVENL